MIRFIISDIITCADDVLFVPNRIHICEVVIAPQWMAKERQGKSILTKLGVSDAKVIWFGKGPILQTLET